MSVPITVSGGDHVANFMASHPVVTRAIGDRVSANGRDLIYFLFAADGSWGCNIPTEHHVQHDLDCDLITAVHIMTEHRKRPTGSSSAVIKFQDAHGATQFYYSYFTVNSKVEDHVLPNAADDVVRCIARKAFYRKRVDVSYNTGAPGIVGVINLRFSVLARECIDNMPDDLYCPHGDNQFELALTLIEQAKDAAVKAVILTKQTASKQ